MARVPLIREAVRDLNRLREISVVVARHGFGGILDQAKLWELLGGKRDVATAPGVEKKTVARRFRDLLTDLGPTFVKLGQVLSSRPDLLPAAWIIELETLQDRVPPFPIAAAREQIEQSLGRTVEECFRTINPEPLASASIAQVHRAVTHEGDEVVVKIQRPKIEEMIRADLDLLYYMARILEAVIEETGVYTPTGIVEEFEASITQELDFLIEAKNVRAFLEHNDGRGYQVIPKVYDALTNRRVLTLQFLEGVKITEACPPHDGKVLARNMLEGAYRQLFEDGLFHGDPHPGNVLVLPDGKLGLLDFGLVGRMTPQMRENIILLVVAVALKDADSVARLIYRVGIPDQRTNLAAFRQDIDAILQRYLGVALKNVESRFVMADLVDLAVRYKIKIPKEYAILSKASMTAEGVIRKLDPELDILALSMPYAKELLSERLDPASILGGGSGMKGILRAQTFLQDVPIQLSQILMDLEGGKFSVNMRSVELEKIHGSLRNLGITLFLGLVTGAFIIGAFLSLAQIDWKIGGYVPFVALLGLFGVATATSLWWLAMSWSAIQGRFGKIKLASFFGRKRPRT